MPYKPSIRAGVALLATAAAGAGAGVIGSAAARPGHHGAAGAAAPSTALPRAPQRRGGGPGARRHAPLRRGGPARRAVHVEAVVPKPGGGFATATIDRGVVTKVAGSTLTLRQGGRRATWRTHSFTVPGDARVVVDHRRGDLSGARAGQIAVVARLPRRTVVRVHDRR